MATKRTSTPKAKRKPAAKGGARKERIARILVDAMYMGENEAAKLWSVSRMSIYRYWDLLRSDAEVLQIVTIEKSRREEQWAARINGPILKALDYFDRVFDFASHTDPDTILAVTQALGTLVEAKTVAGMTHESITADREATAANTTAPTYKTHDLGSNRAIAAA
jgi:hypothetical protein